MTPRTPHFRPLELLECRENPSGGLPTEGFEQVSAPKLPNGWATWSSDGDPQYITSKLQAATGSQALASLGSSRISSRYWNDTQLGGDFGFAASVYANTPVGVEVLTRGTALSTARPSYVAAVAQYGGKVELVEVKDGVKTSLATVRPTRFAENTWLRVSVRPVGDWASVTVQRADNGQYLNAQGVWQADLVDAVRAKVTVKPATGNVGVGRQTGGTGMTYIDDLAALAPPGINESFDTTVVGAVPANWQTWANDGASHVKVGSAKSVSPANGLSIDGGSAVAARAWAGGTTVADANVSATVLADSLIPAGVLARGQNLDTATPTYYSLTVTRGMTVQLKKVVNGTETVLASVRSTAYTSGQWVRLSLIANGDSLSAVVYRTDTRQWLTASGQWSNSPDQAMSLTDTAVRTAGVVGVERSKSAAGSVWFDDFELRSPSAVVGPAIQLAASKPGTSFGGAVTFTATTPAGANVSRLELLVDGKLRASFTAGSGQWELDTTRLTGGKHTLSARAVDANGNVGTATFEFTVSNAGTLSKPDRPTTPPKYTHIRLAQLAYSGNPMGQYEQDLAKNSLDLLIPNPRYLSTLEAAAPTTPKVIYTNVSNLYGELLTDWDAYADARGINREMAFYHVTQPTAFTGASPSSIPVNQFWNVSAVNGTAVTDVTARARGTQAGGVTLTGSVVLGYPEKFNEVNVALSKASSAGWGYVVEYVSAVTADGSPTAWKTLALKSDGTNVFKNGGRLTFDPPADWVASKQYVGTQRLMQVRIRATSGTAADAPVASTILAADYVNANGSDKGTIPVFDSTADKNGDGYLSDTEYATRKAGHDARFEYQSRLFYPYYGQMRFVINPGTQAVRNWAADYHERVLAANPLADGLFLDNSHGKLPFAGTPVKESVVSFTDDYAAMVDAVTRRVSPKWTVSNTAGSIAEADGVAAASSAAFEEFVLRPNDASWATLEDVASLVKERLAADSPSPYLILDSHPGAKPTTDPRTRVGVLSYYYLVADPNKTFLMFFGGNSPAAPWQEVFAPAATVDVGQPAGAMRGWATGTDPANANLTYKVYGRDYGNALVLFKPLSYALGKGTGTTDDATATTHQLNGNYRALNADGTLGPLVTSVTLRNGEGAVLMKA